MSLYETEEEFPETWFEDMVDQHQDRHEKDEEDREESGYADKTDEEWWEYKEERQRLEDE